MLHGNYSILNKSPGRFYSGAGAEAQMRLSYSTPGALRNVQYRSMQTTTYPLWAIPSYYYPEYTWMIPTTRGQITASNFIVGTGNVTTATMAGGRNITAGLTGAGDLTGSGGLIVSATCGITGSGALTANILATLQATAALTGSGAVAATASGLGHLDAALTGTGVFTAAQTALGYMTASINVTGDLLTTATVGSAVWQTLLENGFDASRVLRIIAAATAGESTGGPGSPVFRNLADTQDQITGTADADGDRSAITYGS